MGRVGHLRIGVDTGGTFTDVVAVDTRTGVVTATKTPSTPADPADGFLTGIGKILDLVGATPADVRVDRARHHGGDEPTAPGQRR